MMEENVATFDALYPFLRSDNALLAMATLRNAVLTLLRYGGWTTSETPFAISLRPCRISRKLTQLYPFQQTSFRLWYHGFISRSSNAATPTISGADPAYCTRLPRCCHVPQMLLATPAARFPAGHDTES